VHRASGGVASVVGFRSLALGGVLLHDALQRLPGAACSRRSFRTGLSACSIEPPDCKNLPENTTLFVGEAQFSAAGSASLLSALRIVFLE
jgi:hypothetical protein